jgi:hypothetical protein
MELESPSKLYAPVAQLVEQWPFKPLVPGSIPGRCTNQRKSIGRGWALEAWYSRFDPCSLDNRVISVNWQHVRLPTWNYQIVPDMMRNNGPVAKLVNATGLSPVDRNGLVGSNPSWSTWSIKLNERLYYASMGTQNSRTVRQND